MTTLPPEVTAKIICDMFRQALRLIVLDQKHDKSQIAERMNYEFGISCTAAIMRAAHEQKLKDDHTMNVQGSPPSDGREVDPQAKSEDPPKPGKGDEPGEDQAFIR